ncbi:hypothetical protein LYSHEL_19350 [Lysobacter helvus]|uniref:Uncharacterized protein n=2 Tax=Lysobacteraceae TaxID=32033 RepID=A0ABN6FYL6_9GAMM|nr:hypothetical protein LYSCAS_19360 [Lysobacter caseinilyticus]BCT96064.1 hypothetical protein LYSHEL_19350 [Lysobacter helvus]
MIPLTPAIRPLSNNNKVAAIPMSTPPSKPACHDAIARSHRCVAASSHSTQSPHSARVPRMGVPCPLRIASALLLLAGHFRQEISP